MRYSIPLIEFCLAAHYVAVVLANVQSTPSIQQSSRPVATHVVTVGKANHRFRPEVTQAEIGDVIEFQFSPVNHSVVRAEYGYPCIPYEMTGRGKAGFYSGFHPVDAILSDPPKWSLTVNTTEPLFFYCSATGSCTDWGMVGVINPNSSTSLETHRQIALNSAYSLNPGDPFPAESSELPTSPVSLHPTSTSTSTPATSSARPTLSPGVIAGIVVGGVALIALAAGLFVYVRRSRSLKQEIQQSSTIQHIPPPSPSAMLQASYPTFAARGPTPQTHRPTHSLHSHSTSQNMGMPPLYTALEHTHLRCQSTPQQLLGADPWIAPYHHDTRSSVASPPSRVRSIGSMGGGGGGAYDFPPETAYHAHPYDGEDRYEHDMPVGHDRASVLHSQCSGTPPPASRGFEKSGAPHPSDRVPLGPYGQQVAGTPGSPPGYGGTLNRGAPAEMDGTGVGV